MYPTHPLTIPALTSALLAVALIALSVPACGPQGAGQDPLSVNSWATGEELPPGSSLYGDDGQPADQADANGAGGDDLPNGDKSNADNTVPNDTPAGFYLSHDEIDFGNFARIRTFLVANLGGGSIPYQIDSDADWLTIGTTAGTTSAGYQSINLAVERDNLTPGNYSADLTVTTGLGVFMVSVTMTVGDPQDYPDDGPQLYVNEDQLPFNPIDSQRSFFIRNDGAEELRYSVTSTADWAIVTPFNGASTGEFDRIEVVLNHNRMPDGPQFANVHVRATNGQSHDLQLIAGIPTDPAPDNPETLVSTQSIDFGDTSVNRALTLQNTGGGELEYVIEGGADWLIVEPRDGLVAAETDTVQLRANRNPLIVGQHETTLTLHSTGGDSRTINVAVTKPLTDPLIVPWIELYAHADQDEIDHCVAGLRLWQRVTDTAVVSTGYTSYTHYDELRARVPGMRIIPGIKTSTRLGRENLDSLERWAQLAADVPLFLAATGETTIVFENESAQSSYRLGEYEIDLDLFEDCVAQLPDNVEYYWYPSIECRHDDEDMLGRTQALVERVENAVSNVRFVDISFGDPDWPDYWPSLVTRETLLDVSDTVPLPIIYFGCFPWCYWDYHEVDVVMQQLRDADRPDALFYPGITRWQESAVEINNELWPPVD